MNAKNTKMNTKILIFLLNFTVLNLFAQTKYQKGYFIDNKNNKVECLIKNEDWKFNPESITVKINESDSPELKSKNDIAEFEIENEVKYVRVDSKLDTSSDFDSQLKNGFEPIWENKIMFLKVLIEGDASLYEYHTNSITKFYFKNKSGIIEPLVYKRYLRENNIDVAENTNFRMQLFNEFSSNKENSEDYFKLNYNKKELIKYFSKLNNVTSNKSKLYVKEKKSDFNLKIKAGYNFSDLKIQGPIFGKKIYPIEMGENKHPNLALEFEYILPFNNKKWSVYLESNYQKYEQEYEKKFSAEIFPGYSIDKSQVWNVNNSSINFPLGVKYGFFLGAKSKIVLATEVISTFKLDSSIYTLDMPMVLNTESFKQILGFGLGYTYENKFGVELKYNQKNILIDYFEWSSKLNTFTLNLTYTIFNKK